MAFMSGEEPLNLPIRPAFVGDVGFGRQVSHEIDTRRRSVHSAPSCRSVLVFGVTVAMFFHALDLASRLAQTSDSAQGLVAGHAVARGNLLLSGWHMPLDDYYFTDTIPYAALAWLMGPRPFLLAFVPALTYAAFVCTTLIVCLRPSRPLTENIEATAVVALLLAAPASIANWNPLLLSDMHLATVLYALIALALCARLTRSEGTNARAFPMLCTSLVAVTAITVSSDPFSLVFAFGPALALLTADAVFRPVGRRHRLALLLLAGGTALGLLLPPAIALAGGFTTETDVVTGFAAAPGRNLIVLLSSVLTLSGANPFETDFGLRAVLLLALRWSALAIAIAATVRLAPGLFGLHSASLFERALCAGILTVLAACAVSAQFSKGVTAQAVWTGGPPMRYAMPAVLFAAVLAGRQISVILSSKIFRHGQGVLRSDDTQSHVRTVARGALAVCAVLGVLADSFGVFEANPRWISNNPPAMAAYWLQQHGLTDGVGEYWSSNLITAMSGDEVHVRSVVPDGGKLVPYVWSEDANSYVRAPQFVVWQDGNHTGMTFADVRATYSIRQTTLIAGYRIAVLTHNGSANAFRRVSAGSPFRPAKGHATPPA